MLIFLGVILALLFGPVVISISWESKTFRIRWWLGVSLSVFFGEKPDIEVGGWLTNFFIRPLWKLKGKLKKRLISFKRKSKKNTSNKTSESKPNNKKQSARIRQGFEHFVRWPDKEDLFFDLIEYCNKAYHSIFWPFLLTSGKWIFSFSDPYDQGRYWGLLESLETRRFKIRGNFFGENYFNVRTFFIPALGLAFLIRCIISFPYKRNQAATIPPRA